MYDWKITSLFDEYLEVDEESTDPSPEEFWRDKTPTTFQIGGRKDCDLKAFKAWLASEVGR